MGYFVKGKEIAKISPKARSVSLSASSNYIQFESKEVSDDIVKSSYFDVILSMDQNFIISTHLNSKYRWEVVVNQDDNGGVAGFVLENEFTKEQYTFNIRLRDDYVTEANFPNDILLQKDNEEEGIKSLVKQLSRVKQLNDNYEIEREGLKVRLKAKKIGFESRLRLLDSYYKRGVWEIDYNDPSGEYHYLIDIEKVYSRAILSMDFLNNGKDIASKPFKTQFDLGDFCGYDFKLVKSLPEKTEPVILEGNISVEALEKYCSQNKRVDPYKDYFKEKSGNIYRFVNYTRFAIKDKVKGIERWFQGIDPIMKLSGAYETSDYTYELSEDPIQTAQNLKEALLRCPYVRDNFKVSSPINLDENTGFVEQISVVNLESLSAGKRFNFEIVLNKEKTDDNNAEYDEYKKRFDSFALIKLPDYDSVNPDTINEGAEACEIQIDMYADTGLFLGQDDRPDTDDLGSYVTTLTKTYFNQPVWFDLNSIQTKKYKPPFGAIDSESELQKSDAGVWFDAATYSDRRFVAKRVTSAMSESFYYSPVLYTLTGYERNLDQNDIEKYVYDVSAAVAPDKLVRPLTLQPDLSHVRGQIQYFNFVLKDRDHANNQSNLGLEYELLSQSGALLDTVTDHQQAASQLNVVNTIALDIDRFADQYANLGIVRVRLCRDGQRVSEPLTLNIQPSYLYRVHDFVFLNLLGGWSSFNFGDQDQLDFKTTSTTFFRNQTPSSTRSSSIETVYSKAVEERFVVRTQPITLATADWLKEISTSIAVFERKSQRYVVVDELNVKYTSQDNFVRLEMKYHYSDSFNAQY